MRSKKNNRTLLLTAAVSACAFTLPTRTASAGNGIWLTTGVDSNWGNASNWLGGSIAGSTTLSSTVGDSASFGLSNQTLVLPDAGRVIGTANFVASAGSYTLGASGGNTLYLAGNNSGGISYASTVANSTLTLAGPLGLLAAYQILSNSALLADTIAITGNITNASTVGAQGLQLKGGNIGANILSGTVSNGSFATTLTKLNTGTWIITSNSTYTGSSQVSQGTLILGADVLSGQNGPLGNASSAVSVGVTSSATASATLLVGYGANGYTLGRGVSVLATTNAGTGLLFGVTLGGANTANTSYYTGSVSLLNNVTLQAATGGTVEFSTGTFLAGNKGITIGSSGNLGNVRLNYTTLATTSGVTSAFGTFTENSTLTAGLVVNSGATLAGTGKIVAGATGVAINGNLSPGDLGIGQLNASVTSGTFDISGATANTHQLLFDLGAGSTSDKVVVVGAGGLTIGTLDINDFTFNDAAVALTGPGYSTTYTLFTAASITGALSSVPGALTTTQDFYTETLSSDATNIYLTVTPEPNSIALVLGGSALLLKRRRSQKASSLA